MFAAARPLAQRAPPPQDRLVAIEQAAVGAVKTAIVRKIGERQHEIWLTAMNELAKLLPVTRNFRTHPCARTVADPYSGNNGYYQAFVVNPG